MDCCFVLMHTIAMHLLRTNMRCMLQLKCMSALLLLQCCKGRVDVFFWDGQCTVRGPHPPASCIPGVASETPEPNHSMPPPPPPPLEMQVSEV